MIQKKIQEITSFLKQNLINKEKVNLTLDVIDFLLNYGSTEIIEQIAQKDFLSCIIALLKNKAKSGVEIQKKIISLVKKINKSNFIKLSLPNFRFFWECSMYQRKRLHINLCTCSSSFWGWKHQRKFIYFSFRWNNKSFNIRQRWKNRFGSFTNNISI